EQSNSYQKLLLYIVAHNLHHSYAVMIKRFFPYYPILLHGPDYLFTVANCPTISLFSSYVLFANFINAFFISSFGKSVNDSAKAYTCSNGKLCTLPTNIFSKTCWPVFSSEANNTSYSFSPGRMPDSTIPISC